MFGWRRRKDGFEWREYVRTTILVRRKNRRDRLEQAGKAAADGLRAVGERGMAAGAAGAGALGRGAKAAGHQGVVMGAAGAEALGRGAMAAGRQGASLGAAGAGALGRGAMAAGRKSFALGAAGIRAADEGLRAGLPVALAAIHAFVTACGRGIAAAAAFVWGVVSAVALGVTRVSAPAIAAAWERLEPSVLKLRKPGIALVLAAVAAVCFIGSFRRLAANGFSGAILIALIIGTVITCALLAAWLAQGAPAWLTAFARGTGRAIRRAGEGLRRIMPSGAVFSRLATYAVVLVIVLGAGWVVWRGASALPSLMSSTPPLEGRGLALTGDTLRVAKTTIALAGIEAPLPGQTCQTARSRSWRCDRAARSALVRLLDDGTARCEFSGSDDNGRKLATCHVGDKDIAAELVRSGHVFATSGYFSSYSSLEDEARAEKRGIWTGTAERPQDYRAQKWQDAKRTAPDGCPIKGNVEDGRRVYVLPWSQDYARTKVSSRRGERWFCSEAEAQAAGWKPSERS